MKADNNHNFQSLKMGGEFTGHQTRSQGPPDYTEMAADNSPPIHECLNKPGKRPHQVKKMKNQLSPHTSEYTGTYS